MTNPTVEEYIREAQRLLGAVEIAKSLQDQEIRRLEAELSELKSAQPPAADPTEAGGSTT